jgi:hypothetical protein
MAKAALSIDGGVTGLAMPNVLKRLRRRINKCSRLESSALPRSVRLFPASGVR